MTTHRQLTKKAPFLTTRPPLRVTNSRAALNPSMNSQGLNRIWMGWATRSLAPVVGLVLGVFPSAVIRSVWAVVIYSAKCVCVWTWSHISKKLGERVDPLGADSDSTSAVGRILWIIRVEAPLLHRRPGVIFSAMTKTVGQTRGIAHCVARSTAGYATSCKFALNNEGIFPARAFAMPRSIRAAVSQRYNTKISEY